MNKKVGIVGNGYVGGATALLACDNVEVVIYDIDPEKCVPKGSGAEALEGCDVVFICVPTPMNPDGSCNLDIVNEAVEEAATRVDRHRIVIKSTVPVGTASRLGVCFMPEFLTEANWEEDFANCEHWIVGEDDSDWVSRDPWGQPTSREIMEIFAEAEKAQKIKYLNFNTCTTREAELVKYVRNTYLATKISYFCEVDRVCEKMEIEYDTVRELVCLDPRIESSHTFVPGPDGKKGFGGTCFPKDINSFIDFAKAAGVKTNVMNAAWETNLDVRSEKDWESNKGRSVV